MLQSLNLDCDAPLRIGFGQHDYFNGRMRDFRIYNRALSNTDIEQLANRFQTV
jgi:hypothetical protein